MVKSPSKDQFGTCAFTFLKPSDRLDNEWWWYWSVFLAFVTSCISYVRKRAKGVLNGELPSKKPPWVPDLAQRFSAWTTPNKKTNFPMNVWWKNCKSCEKPIMSCVAPKWPNHCRVLVAQDDFHQYQGQRVASTCPPATDLQLWSNSNWPSSTICITTSRILQMVVSTNPYETY